MLRSRLSDSTLISRVPDWVERPSSHRSSTNKIPKPLEVACFSRTSDGAVHLGSRKALRKILKPQLPANLNTGFESYVPENYVDLGDKGAERLGPVLQALRMAEFNVEEEADFVAFRRSFFVIALTPYQLHEDWEINAIQLGSTIFLSVRHHEKEKYPNQDRYEYYGYAFESVCYGERKPDEKKEDFFSIVRLGIGRHRILLCAEIDGLMQSTPKIEKGEKKGVEKYVELKTVKRPCSLFEIEKLHRFKFHKIWVQCFLGGVPKILLGLREENGRLLKILELETVELKAQSQSILRRSRVFKAWKSSACLNHLDFILREIRRKCATEEGTGFIFKYDSQEKSIYSCPADENASRFVSRMRNLVEE